jgi:hypothetical protein
MVEEPKLAWALAEITHPYFYVAERNDIYVAIGAGDTFSAICSLITVIVRERLPLLADVVAMLPSWINGYAADAAVRHVHGLIASLQSQPRHPPSATEAPRRTLPIADRYHRDRPTGRQ